MIIDQLCDHEKALKTCCLLSKSWVPYAQKHLFKTITFTSSKGAAFWRERFPDPLKPPACYIRSLYFLCTGSITNEDSSWIRSFPAVVELKLLTNCDHIHKHGSNNLPALLRDLLPKVKSLEIQWESFTAQEILAFICSFPILENLRVWQIAGSQVGMNGTISQPSTLPLFTGTLALLRMQGFMRLLVELPGDFRFRKIETSPCEFGIITKLVEKSSATLECIDIDFTGVSGKSCTFAPRQLQYLI